jgi:CheY-like chemotaxis protein
MTQPLALVFYERLLPGTQLVNRLQDLAYRVQTVHAAEALVTTAETEKPLLVFADLESTKSKVGEVIAQLKQNPATKHLPVIGFASESKAELQAAATAAGAVGVSDAALLGHLPQLLDQALQLE